MKRAMQIEPLDSDLRKLVGQRINLIIQPPGIVRSTMLAVRSSLISTNKDGLELAPTIIFEIDPDQKGENRVFTLVPANKVIESSDHIEYRGHFLYPDGNILFLFEEIDEPADFVALAKKTFLER